MDITQLPFPRYKGLKHNKLYKTTETLFLEQWQIPKGITVRLVTGQDFGYVILPSNCHLGGDYELQTMETF